MSIGEGRRRDHWTPLATAHRQPPGHRARARRTRGKHAELHRPGERGAGQSPPQITTTPPSSVDERATLQRVDAIDPDADVLAYARAACSNRIDHQRSERRDRLDGSSALVSGIRAPHWAAVRFRRAPTAPWRSCGLERRQHRARLRSGHDDSAGARLADTNADGVVDALEHPMWSSYLLAQCPQRRKSPHPACARRTQRTAALGHRPCRRRRRLRHAGDWRHRWRRLGDIGRLPPTAG